MNRLEKQRGLAKEAVKLLEEFSREAGLVVESLFSSVEVNEIGNKIIIEDLYDNEECEYELTKISSPIEKELYGADPCGGYGLYDAIEDEREEARNNYKSVSREEFIKYIGCLSYVELRVDDIYERLKEIEEEAKVLA